MKRPGIDFRFRISGLSAAAYGLWLIAYGFLPSCYSFKDASTDPNLKTARVSYFDNRAPIVNPSLSQLFTEALKSKITSETNLDIIDQGADVDIRGVITQYDIAPIAAQAGETAALNRLTISVEVEFTNNQEESKSWESRFSRFADFSRDADFSSVEDGLVNEINTQLVDDIFKRAFVNW